MWGEVIDSIHYFKQTSILNRCVQLRNENYWHLCDKTSDLAANIDCTRTQGQMIVNAHLFMSLILSNKSSTIMRHECSYNLFLLRPAFLYTLIDQMRERDSSPSVPCPVLLTLSLPSTYISHRRLSLSSFEKIVFFVR